MPNDIERTDTRSGLMPGSYQFVVSEVPTKGEFKPGVNYYEFKFLASQLGGQEGAHSERIPVWKSAPILRAIGAKEIEPEVFEWNREDMVGIQFKGEIINETATNGKVYRRLFNPVAIPGFPKDPSIIGSKKEDGDVPF